MFSGRTMRRAFLCLALLIGLSMPSTAQAAACSNTAVGAFTCVQSYSLNKTASTTPAWTLPSNIAASTNVVVGLIVWTSASATLSGIAGSGAGCTGATVVIYDNPTSLAGNWRAASFSVRGLSTGQCILTATLSASVASSAIFHEIAGALSTSDPVGARHALAGQSAVGTGTDAITVGPVTASGTDYIFGGSVECSEGSVINAGTGYTGRQSENGTGQCQNTSEDKSASGSNTVTFTATNALAYPFSAILSVAPAAGAAAPCTRSLLGVGCLR